MKTFAISVFIILVLWPICEFFKYGDNAQINTFTRNSHEQN